MAKTASNMVELGTQAPDFTLLEPLHDKRYSLTELKGDKATVIMFICNHCPFVKHIQEELVRIANDYLSKDIAFIAINSNDTENYPEDSPEKMKEVAQSLNYPFPYLFDETQDVARAYNAACTPDFYVFDQRLKLIYRGQLDDSRPGNTAPINGANLREALDAILTNEPLCSDQKPSVGCNIKWKESNK